MLTPEDIAKFKVLFEKNFGEQLSDKEAALRARRLIQLYATTYGKDSPANAINTQDLSTNNKINERGKHS